MSYTKRSDGRKINDSTFLQIIENKKGSIRMVEPSHLISNTLYSKWEYLNISSGLPDNAGVAEWLLQLFDKQRPLGFVGSIPISSVSDNFSGNLNLNIGGIK